MKHVDPLSVLDILGVNVTNTSPPPPPYMSPLPPPIPSNNTPYTCGCCFLQDGGSTALMLASQNGHTEIVLALLAAADINVNHADVSIYPLTPPHPVVTPSVS